VGILLSLMYTLLIWCRAVWRSAATREVNRLRDWHERKGTNDNDISLSLALPRRSRRYQVTTEMKSTKIPNYNIRNLMRVLVISFVYVIVFKCCL
jgi:hypothetical protein